MPQQSSTQDGGPGSAVGSPHPRRPPGRRRPRTRARTADGGRPDPPAAGLHRSRGRRAVARDERAALHDPSGLPDLDAAVARIGRAIDAGERIVVHGDYDADGICGTALLTRGLRRLGAVVEPFVPDRQRDGYGVAAPLIEHAGRSRVGLLITVDTGSSAHESLGRARELGIDVIVCDHHRFERHPDGAGWFVNPLRPDSRYPHSPTFAVAASPISCCGRGRPPAVETPTTELPLAALATIGDQMPLRGENRILVRRGLAALGATRIPGLRALMEVARIGRRVDVEDVAFQIAPRINAPGRIERARTTLDLLLAPDAVSARSGAQRLEALNRERKRIGAECADDAVAHGGAPDRGARSRGSGPVVAGVAPGRGRASRRRRSPVPTVARRSCCWRSRATRRWAAPGACPVGGPRRGARPVRRPARSLRRARGRGRSGRGDRRMSRSSRTASTVAIRRPAGAEVAPPLRIDAILGHEDRRGPGRRS